jgi:lysylphosphatidylglycerol synthetase-like protein (DUF2156 family)
MMLLVVADLADQGPAAPRGPASDPTRRRLARLAAVVAAFVATLALWALATLVFDVELLSPALPDRPSETIGPELVAGATLSASIAGWALLAFLERFVGRARTIWTTVAVVVLLASLGAPLSGTGVTAANRAVLTLLHLTVAAVLIPVFYRTSPAR